MSEPAGPADGAQAGTPTRLDRRKARTRRALLDAARAIIAERDTSDVSIQEITDRADVGFGSFYNHFATKAELFDAALAEVLEEHGRMLDRVTAGVEDPAEVFAVGVRATAAMAEENPAAAQVFLRAGLGYLLAPDGLTPRALRDAERAVAAGRFRVDSPFLAITSTTGCLLAYLHVRLNAPERLGPAPVEELTEQILRIMGMPHEEAREISRRPLPAPLQAPDGA